MNICIKREELIENMSIVGQVVNKSATMPILKLAKVNIKEDGSMIITGFDGEMSIIKKFQASSAIEKTVDFCISPLDLVNTLKTVRDEVIELNFDDNNCEIRHAKGVVSFPIEPIENFPNVEIEKDAPKYTFNVKQLTEWLKKASRFVSQDKIRPIINGVYLYAQGDEVGVASSDGLFLFNDYTNLGNNEEHSQRGVLSTKAVAPLINMIQGEEEVIAYFGEKLISFRTRGARLSCIKPVGSYPNFKPLIAKREGAVRVIVDKREIMDSLSRVILSTQAGSTFLHLSISTNALHLDGEDLGFNKKSHDECPCEATNSGIHMGVKGTNLVECINAIDADKVIMEFVGDTKPIFFYDEECPNKTILTMPMSL